MWREEAQEAGVASQNTVRLRAEEGRPRGSGRPAHEEVLGGRGKNQKNLPANAGDTGSIPKPGRSHMLWSN